MSGAHSSSRSRRHAPRASSRATRRRLIIAGVGLLVVALVAGATVISRSGPKVSASPTTAPSAQAAVSRQPLEIVSVTPVDGTSGVASDATLTVKYSVPLSPRSPVPTLTPAVAGSWQQVDPTTQVFVAAAPLVPSSSETLTVPAGAGGILGTSGQTLDQGATVHFTRGRRRHPPPAAAAGPTGLPARRLHPGRPAGRPPGAGPAPGGHLRLAVRRAGRAHGPVDPGPVERDHQGRGHGLRGQARDEGRRRGGPGRVGRAPRRRDRRDRRHGRLQLRPRHQDPARAGHRLLERRGRLLDAGQHRRHRGHDGRRHLPRLRAPDVGHHVRHQPGRLEVPRSRASRG